ncbi:MAG: 1-acyl-sn-glycerol-3-phosphate acyltransferase [Clostridiales bacterium]|nr:1-acyl-sn-glycerol-3-phosphate acyltransferase [Clostridiales bacterium]
MAATERRAVGTPFYRFARGLLAAFSALFYPCKIVNQRAADLNAPLILICNHQSMMDPVLLAVKLPQHEIHFIGKREITKFKPLKWVVERLHMIAISRHMSDLAAMRAAGAALKGNHVLGIFPEGKRCDGPSMDIVESGASLLAQRHKVPLLPVYIAGRPRPFRRVIMEVAPPLQYEDLLGEGIDKAATERINQRIRQLYQDFDIKYNKKTIGA